MQVVVGAFLPLNIQVLEVGQEEEGEDLQIKQIT